MTRLNQIIAIEKGVKNKAFEELSAAYHAFQKTQPLSGISRRYRPKNEDGDQLPGESTNVQTRTTEVVRKLTETLARLFDVTATKDVSNTQAKANVVIDGEVLLEDVPVSYLLFLEKQLVNLHTFIEKLPKLDPSDTWVFDPTVNVYATPVAETTRTKKVPRNHVKAEATDKHPAQVEVYFEDVVEGYWQTVKFSGALPASQIAELLARVEKIQQAVKFAREEANSIEVQDVQCGKKFFDYLFG